MNYAVDLMKKAAAEAGWRVDSQLRVALDLINDEIDPATIAEYLRSRVDEEAMS